MRSPRLSGVSGATRALRAAICLLVLTSAAASAGRPAAQPEPTAGDVAYGEHTRQVLDFWRAPGEGPRPLLLIIHGGGWLNNDKTSFMARRHKRDIAWMHARGVSVAAINYRYSSIAPLPAPVHDAARSLQFLRHKAEAWGIDKERIVATGSSAGGCTALWLATHDDLADPEATDPVARQSTRLTAAVAVAAQTAIDPMILKTWFGDHEVTHQMIHTAAGFKSRAAMFAGYEAAAPVYAEFSPITHLDKDDPPILLSYGGKVAVMSDLIHHPIFGVQFKRRATAVGATCLLDLRRDLAHGDQAPAWRQFVLTSLNVQTPASK
jgi:acetyl esterase/lipase